jgi:hypothetical protein
VRVLDCPWLKLFSNIYIYIYMDCYLVYGHVVCWAQLKSVLHFDGQTLSFEQQIKTRDFTNSKTNSMNQMTSRTIGRARM